MKFTLSWLKEHLETEADLDLIVETLNKIGLEVEEVIDNSKKLKSFNCVKIEECAKHPDSDHLNICQVRYDNSKEPITIVCGAPNARSGLKTVLAPINSVLPNGLEIKKSKIRGIESNGMLCSQKELDIGDDHHGIIELPESVNIGENIANIFKIDDPVIEISITPNRGDCLSVYGIARDLAVAGIGKLKTSEKEIEIDKKFTSEKSLVVYDKHCYYYAFRQIKNVKNTESPKFIQKRLKVIGINPKNMLVDVTNYTMMTFGIPLHCYDCDKIIGNISVRKANEGETFVDLFENTHILTGNETLICDDIKPLCLGGVMGGMVSSSEMTTKNILLEGAVFDPINTAKTGRKLCLQSDARYRFERGVDFEMVYHAISFATELILDVCGGESSNLVEFVDSEYRNKNIRTIEFNLSSVKRILGLEIHEKDILRLLDGLGYKVEERDNDKLNLLIPSWKNNILVEEDIIDDLIRIYGYEKLNDNDFVYTDKYEKEGNKFTKSLKNKLYEIRKDLVSNGMIELVSYAFINKDDCKLFAETNENLELLNPIISDLSYIRQNLLPNILNVIKRNSNRGFNDLSLFEVGKVFNSNKPTDENNIIAGVRYGKNKEKDVYEPSRFYDIFDVKEDIFEILSIFGINAERLTITRDVPKYYHPNRSGAILMGKIVLGYFGELHPSLNKHFDLKERINAFELFVDNIPQKTILSEKSIITFKTNDLQPVERDFAFILDSKIEVGNILKDILNLNKTLISSAKLFDIYYYDSEENINKKSVAFKVLIQPIDKTLTKDEIDNVCNSIIDLVSKKYSGVLRDK